MEEVKRLNPIKDVLRELYLKSGNQCAYPSCLRPILNSEGNIVGEICHIEAAMTGGERFNPSQTNEERRAYSNLILMCHDHHIETNKVEKYPVDLLQKMKAEHEGKFGDPIGKLYATIADLTTLQEYEYCQNLNKLNDVLEWNNTKQELETTVPLFNSLVDMLRILPTNTRKFFSIMVKRSEGSTINLNEIIEATGSTDELLMKHVNILIKYNFIDDIEQDDYGSPYCDFSQYDLWDMWIEIKNFALKTGIEVDAIIYEMKFSLLD